MDSDQRLDEDLPVGRDLSIESTYATSKPHCRGAKELHAAVRKVIAAHLPGDKVLMSAAHMIEIMTNEMGVSPLMANRLYSQIRKGAPLREEWKAAFASGKFVQSLGRTASVAKKPKLTSTGSAHALDAASNDDSSGRDEDAHTLRAPKRARPGLFPEGLYEMAIICRFNDETNSMGVPSDDEVRVISFFPTLHPFRPPRPE